ncbi:MAG: penicillin-binding protein 2 [Firmicutes bacterium]|nr:penicillin-binding protein 2 [Bacillota bacterium]
MKRSRFWPCVLGIGFLLLVGGAFYWQVWQRETLAYHPLNPHVQHQRRVVKRGRIWGSHGEVIAESIEGLHGFRRVYLGTLSLAPITGYDSQRYGVAGLEKAYDSILMGRDYPGRSVLGILGQGLTKRGVGYDVVTTIDMSMQRSVEMLLEGRKGAVIVMEAKTGRILAAASTPGFSPNDIDAHWAVISTDGDSPLFNRAFAGFYPPGSTFKLVVLAAGLASGKVVMESSFDDPGAISIHGYTITNSDGTDKRSLSLTEALALSSNVVFVRLAQEIGSDAILDMARAFGLGQKPPLIGGSVGSGRIPTDELTAVELAQMAIGQYNVAVSPLQMTLLVQALANEGLMMRPTLVSAVHDPVSGKVWTNPPEPIRQVVKAGLARKMREALAVTVQRGTGRQAALPHVEIAGKTGSAENPQGVAHAWFVGMAPTAEPEICVTIILENAGSGGKVAAPLAREIFRVYFNGIQGAKH